MSKGDVLGWINLVVAAFAENPVIALAMVVAILALAVAYRAVDRKS